MTHILIHETASVVRAWALPDTPLALHGLASRSDIAARFAPATTSVASDVDGGNNPMIAPCRAADVGCDDRGVLNPVHWPGGPAILDNPLPVLGLLARRPDFDGVLCLLGDITTWIKISAGEICHFQCDASRAISAAGPVAGPIEAHVRKSQGRSSRLGTYLAEVAAAERLQLIDANEAASARVGLAIGAELDAAKAYWLGEAVVIAGPKGLADAYCSALNGSGVRATTLAYDALLLAGANALWMPESARPLH